MGACRRAALADDAEDLLLVARGHVGEPRLERAASGDGDAAVAEVFDNALDDIGPALRDLRPVGGDLLLRDAGDDLPGELVGGPAPEFAEG